MDTTILIWQITYFPYHRTLIRNQHIVFFRWEIGSPYNLTFQKTSSRKWKFLILVVFMFYTTETMTRIDFWNFQNLQISFKEVVEFKDHKYLENFRKLLINCKVWPTDNDMKQGQQTAVGKIMELFSSQREN